MAKQSNSWDSEENEVKSNWVKFNVPLEDKIVGTLIAKRQQKSNIKGKENEQVWVYELKADLGQFHEVDDKKKLIESPIVIQSGEIWSVGGKPAIDAQMRNIKVGQKVGFKFIDEKANKIKGYSPAKFIKVYTPKNDDGTVKMDDEFLAERENSDAGFDGM